MTRIDFHFNAPEKIAYGCRLVRKIFRAGQRVVVFSDPPSLAAFDAALWTFSALDFIPHVAADSPLAGETPVLLCSEAVDTAHCDVLVNLSAGTPSFFSRFERLVEVVGATDEDRQQARQRWRFYKERGYQLESFDLAAAGA